jgi:hypothetical protein
MFDYQPAGNDEVSHVACSLHILMLMSAPETSPQGDHAPPGHNLHLLPRNNYCQW